MTEMTHVISSRALREDEEEPTACPRELLALGCIKNDGFRCTCQVVTSAAVETTADAAGRKTHLALTVGIANNYGSAGEVLADIKLTGYKATVTANHRQVQAVFNLDEVDNERLKNFVKESDA